MSLLDIELTGRPEFHVKIDLATIHALMTLAQRHYDGTCRAAAYSGGFLYGWKNTMTGTTILTGVHATFRELDLTLKIVENCWAYDDIDRERVDAYCVRVRLALRAANDIVPTWSRRL